MTPKASAPAGSLAVLLSLIAAGLFATSIATPLHAQQTPAPDDATKQLAATASPAGLTMPQLLPAILPTPRLDEPAWAARHQNILSNLRAHRDYDLLLLGDSITQNYEKSSPAGEAPLGLQQDFLPIWQQFYQPRHALNLGFSGDTTANLLWRLTHGEIDNIHPHVAILLIGTNNTAHGQSAAQTVAGIRNVIGTLAQRLPQTRIILLGILPSNVSAEKTAADQAVNAWLSTHYGLKKASPQNNTAEASEETSKAANTANTAATAPTARFADGTGASALPATAVSPDAATAAASSKATPQAKPSDDTPESRITYLDLSSLFGKPGDTPAAVLFYDPGLTPPRPPLHPTPATQRRIAEAIEPTLAKLMHDTPRTKVN